MEDKNFYWIKLKNTFMTSDTVDFLMSQKSGANYVVLYQMLCLKTINTNGELARKIGEIIIPYDADKIQRDCKYFDIDTIRVALELYKQLGLIYMQEDSILKIANFENMIGSETAWAEKKRLYRQKCNVKLESGQSADNVLDNFRQEKEIRDKILDKDIKENIPLKGDTKEKEKSFSSPRSKKEILLSMLSESLLSESVKSTLQVWLEYKKYSYAEVGFKALLTVIGKRVDEFEEEPVCELITECMSNNWQGIIWDKITSKTKASQQKTESFQEKLRRITNERN